MLTLTQSVCWCNLRFIFSFFWWRSRNTILVFKFIRGKGLHRIFNPSALFNLNFHFRLVLWQVHILVKLLLLLLLLLGFFRLFLPLFALLFVNSLRRALVWIRKRLVARLLGEILKLKELASFVENLDNLLDLFPRASIVSLQFMSLFEQIDSALQLRQNVKVFREKNTCSAKRRNHDLFFTNHRRFYLSHQLHLFGFHT